MKIIRNASDTVSQDLKSPADRLSAQLPVYTWKILVVDDEPDVRTLTRISLRDFSFANRNLEIIEACSAVEAKRLLTEHSDIAVA